MKLYSKMDLSNKEEVGKLVGLCVKGDRKAQKILYQICYGRMLSVCNRYTDSPDEAKDILHDAFIKIYASLKSFENKGSLEGWIRRIIVNTAIDYVRKKKEVFLEELIEGNTEADDTAMPFDEMDDQKLKEMHAEVIIELIQKLSPAYRTIFNLYVIEGYSHGEIAEELEINVGTSKSNLAKAKMKLRELFDQYLAENE